MRDAVEMLGLHALRAAVCAAPLREALALGRGCGRLFFRLGLRRRVCLQNLELALGERLERRARGAVAVRAYESLGMLLAELVRLPRLPATARRDRLEIAGGEHLQHALARGRGAIVASAHYGNWEFLGAGAVAHGYPVTFVVQHMRNVRVDRLLWRTRESLGLRVLSRGMALRRVQQELLANRFVCIMCDQDARRRGVFVPFFGVPASTYRGAAQLALRLGSPFIPVFGLRLPDGNHRMIVRPPLEPPRGVPEEQAVPDLLARFNRELEEIIWQEPGQYLWMHRRWKTQPPRAPDQLGARALRRQASA